MCVFIWNWTKMSWNNMCGTISSSILLYIACLLFCNFIFHFLKKAVPFKLGYFPDASVDWLPSYCSSEKLGGQYSYYLHVIFFPPRSLRSEISQMWFPQFDIFRIIPYLMWKCVACWECRHSMSQIISALGNNSDPKKTRASREGRREGTDVAVQFEHHNSKRDHLLPSDCL